MAGGIGIIKHVLFVKLSSLKIKYWTTRELLQYLFQTEYELFSVFKFAKILEPGIK